MRVIALDPGGTTGAAIREITGRVWSYSFENRQHLYQWLEAISFEPTTYVVETFVPRPGVRTWVPDSLFIWGYVDGRIPFWHPDSRLVLQTPAQAKAFMTDEKLRTLGWWSTNDHARDALRHLGYAIIGSGILGQEEKQCLLQKLVNAKTP